MLFGSNNIAPVGSHHEMGELIVTVEFNRSFSLKITLVEFWWNDFGGCFLHELTCSWVCFLLFSPRKSSLRGWHSTFYEDHFRSHSLVNCCWWHFKPVALKSGTLSHHFSHSQQSVKTPDSLLSWTINRRFFVSVPWFESPRNVI